MPDLTSQALAAVITALLDAAKAKDHASRTVIGVNRSQLEGEAIGLDAAAALVRERLAPAHAALVAERDKLARQLADNELTHAEYRQTALELLAGARNARDVATQVTRVLTAENARFHAALEKLATPPGEGRNLTWLHEHDDYCEDESCQEAELAHRATIAREALEGGR